MLCSMGSRPARLAHYCATAALAALGSSFVASVSARAQGAPPASPPGRAHPRLWPRLVPPVAPDPALEGRITRLLERMTLEQKVGQLIQADIGSVTPADVGQLALGSVLNGANSSPRDDKLAAPSDWFTETATTDIDTLSLHDALPVLWGTDAVHGH